MNMTLVEKQNRALLWTIYGLAAVVILVVVGTVVFAVYETHSNRISKDRCERIGGYWMGTHDGHVCLDSKVVLHP